MDFFFIAVLVLGFIAILDLVVGVSNDAANFLNSSYGSKVAPRKVILIIASLGILTGVLFSSGMMEVARKGIFNPQFFTMPDLIILFLAVMIADILILDLFNTYGLPTSTTVSIVFELLGAAVALSVIKIISSGESLAMLDQYINSSKALTIIGGILLSVIVAFIAGAIVQYAGRLLFTFDYQSNLNKFAGLWGGLSFAAISMLVLLKGAKGASFMTPEVSTFIKGNLWYLFLAIFIASGLVFQTLASIFKVNILKPIVLIGTFSLALAFAANDLVNFIGVPIAAYQAYAAAQLTADPLTASMASLGGKVPTSGFILFFAGVVMVLALWLSRKARSVSQTELGLSTHEEDDERFESIGLSRAIVRFFSTTFEICRFAIPRPLRKFVRRRMDRNLAPKGDPDKEKPMYDLLRASSNLMVASAVVSFATSLKLPLSTTYVTFMVAMGTSFADQAWGRETAVYRITGVMTVVGGWFMTAIMASTTAAVFCSILYFGGAVGATVLIAFALFMLVNTHILHRKRAEQAEKKVVYNLKKVTDAESSIKTSYEQTAHFIDTLSSNLLGGLKELQSEERIGLKGYYRERKRLRSWSNVIAANIFKSMRLLHREELAQQKDYPYIVTCLQNMAEAYRDTLTRSYSHVSENHKRMLSVQLKELLELQSELDKLLVLVSEHLKGESQSTLEVIKSQQEKLNALASEYSKLQNTRIHEGSSKTRLSILYYAIVGNMLRISRQTVRLFEVIDTCLYMKNESVAAAQSQ